VTEKRFPPSVERLRKARRDGNIVKSRILIASIGWGVLFLLFLATRPWVRIGTLIQWFTFKVLNPAATLKYSLLLTAALLLMSIGSVAVASVLTSLLQTKGLVTTKPIVPDLTRLQPLGYARRLRESVGDAALGVFRVSVIITLMVPLLVCYLCRAPILLSASREWLIPGISQYLVSAAARGIGALIVLGICAYGLVWLRHMRQQRMSFEEVREEYKENEGDPHLRAARRQEHQALAMAEIEKRVRSSKVLVIRKRPPSPAGSLV
jgi:flagellar biosynthesis protein FlhB